MEGTTSYCDTMTESTDVDTESSLVEESPVAIEESPAPRKPGRARRQFFRVLRRLWHGLQFLGVLAAAAAVFVALVRAKVPPGVADSGPFALPVAVVAAEPGDHGSTLFAYGEIIARRSADVRARVGGPVIHVSDQFANGAPVTAGDILLELDPFEYERRVEETGAAVREAEARLTETRETSRHQNELVVLAEERRNLTRSEYERQADLAEQNISARRTLEAAQSKLSSAEADLTTRRQQAAASAARIAQQEAVLERLQAAAARSRRALSDTRIRAAFNGRLAQVSADLGQQVAPGERIARLIDTNALEVRFFIPEGQLARLADIADGGIGAICVVSWRTDGGVRTYTARVTRIEGEIQAGRAGVHVYALISETSLDADPIRPGAFVEVELYEESHVGTFRLPYEAVRAGPSVLVVADGVAEAREVGVVARAGNQILVRGNLADEHVIVTRSAELTPGDLVRVVAGGGQDGN